MKKSRLLIFLFLNFLVLHSIVSGQYKKGVSKEDYIQLGNIVCNLYGSEYQISDIMNPDSLYPGKYSNLRGCLVFGADCRGLDPPPPFIGIFKENQVIWTSEREIENWLSPEIYMIIDLINDGSPEIIVSFGGGVSSISYELWIYKWNGANGTRVNPVREGSSLIGRIDMPDNLEIVDTDGDGLMELKITTVDNKALYFYWDGSQYSEKKTEEVNILPRDRLNIKFKTTVEKIDQQFRYRYFIINDITSLQSVDDFMVEPAAGLEIASIQSREFWKPASSSSFVRWTNLSWYGKINYISPGEGDSSFSILRNGLPRISKYYIQGHNGDDFSGARILTNSNNGFSIAPGDSSYPLINREFLDTLSLLATRARDIGWITTQPIADKYLNYFSNAKTNLQQNNLEAVRTTLNNVLHDVNIDSSSTLTCEAYALLRYNTEYLLKHLPSSPPSGCNVKLINSSGVRLSGGSLQYYEGSWKNAVNNNDGTFSVNTTQKTVSLRMTYEYGSQTKSNVPITSDTVVFQTVNAQVKLQNSQGNPIDTGVVQYYAGAWRSFGSTSNGIASKELLPANYSFRMTYAYASKDKQQDLSTDPVVVFQTVNAEVQLQNSRGTPIDAGTVQYYSGAWRTFGSTTNGVATKELLPNNYSFRMTYAFASKDKQQDIGANPTVVFQTVNAAVQLQNSQGASIDTGSVQYYSGAWRVFGTTINGTTSKELLPNNYSFRMTNEYVSNDKAQDLAANNTVIFSALLCTIRVKNSQNQPVNNATASYYSGAWRQIGLTQNGEITKELLPANLTFRIKSGTAQQDKTQNLSANNVVEFTLPQ